ncbi:hypothetical protein Tco_0682358 [Tanacetum coccineum]|uniref:Uncharacterized protein n=1 Tax=Tanacetum coccineum TaxID=301880 RepID=A0ABQ4XSA8_9ASTR
MSCCKRVYERSLSEHKSLWEEKKQEKMWHWHDDTSIPGTRLEPRSDKESPKVEIVQEKEEETTKDTEVEPEIKILQRARDAYHNLKDDDIMKNIFNSGRNKNKVGMRIPAWMITDEMKLTEHYKMTPSAPRSPNPATETAESSVTKRSTVIRFRLPSRWVNKCVKKFNPYARYGDENRKNPPTKIFYIRRQKEPGRLKEEIYSNSKIVQVIKTYWELGHEHKFITEIVARRANDCIVSITEPDYKNLNKNDIEDMYLLIVNNKVPNYANTRLLWSLLVFIGSLVIWERVHDFQLGIESYQQKINLTAPTITFPGIEEYDVFSIVYEPVHGIIYTNSKKEKRVMRPSEIHKFCDATLRRTLEGLKSYYNDVKYGYVQKELTNDEVEFLKLFEEEIEVRLNYRDQMRRWEMYVNGRPLGPIREHPE